MQTWRWRTAGLCPGPGLAVTGTTVPSDARRALGGHRPRLALHSGHGSSLHDKMRLPPPPKKRFTMNL